MRGRRPGLAGAEERLGLGHRHRQHLADVAAAELVLQHGGLEALALALLAGRRDRVHEAELGVDDAGAVAGRAGALGVGAEQGRLHAVRLRERRPDRVEQPRVRRRVAPARAADRALVDRPPRRRVPRTEPWMSELLPDPATPVTTTSTPSGMSTSTSCRLLALAPRTSSAPDGARIDAFSDARSSRCRPVIVPLARSPSTVPSNTTSPPAVPAPGPRSTTWSAMRDRLGLVLDDEHRVALVAQAQQQLVHPLDVVGMQADRRLVEDVGDVGQRRAEVADHLGALRLAAGQRAGRPIEREVAEPDLDERVEQVRAGCRAAARPTARRGPGPRPPGR